MSVCRIEMGHVSRRYCLYQYVVYKIKALCSIDECTDAQYRPSVTMFTFYSAEQQCLCPLNLSIIA